MLSHFTNSRIVRYFAPTVVILLCFVAVGCGTATNTIGTSIALSNPSSITIANDWSGLGSPAPIVVHYTLTRKPTAYEGDAQFSVGAYPNPPATVTAPVAIPVEQVERFLSLLATTPVVPGKYVPNIAGTDDYPSLLIRLAIGTETVTFASTSTGAEHIPWAVTFHGTTYVSESGIPFAALEQLDPYLKQDILKELTKQVEAQ